MFNIGVIGCGMIAERGHLPAIKHVPELELHALYDTSFDRAKQLQSEFGANHAYPTSEAFFDSDVDAIVVCTPAPVHHRNVADAAASGTHVLCEKPLGMDEDEMTKMKETMDEADLQLFTGFNYRFSQSALDIRRLVREGAIGHVRLLRLTYNWHLHGKWEYDEHGERVESPLRVGRMKEGGPLVDCGVHQIDLARWWLGSEVEWQRGIGVWLDAYEAPDHVYLHMGHACGAHTNVEVSFSYNATSREPRTHFQYELIGTDGVIRYNREEHSFELRNSHGTQHLPWHPEKSFVGLHEEFARALSSGSPEQMPTAGDGILASRIAQKATDQAVRERNQPNLSEKRRATDVHVTRDIPLDDVDLPVNSPTMRGRRSR